MSSSRRRQRCRSGNKVFGGNSKAGETKRDGVEFRPIRVGDNSKDGGNRKDGDNHKDGDNRKDSKEPIGVDGWTPMTFGVTMRKEPNGFSSNSISTLSVCSTTPK